MLAVKLAGFAVGQQVLSGPSDLPALWNLCHCHDAGEHFPFSSWKTLSALCRILLGLNLYLVQSGFALVLYWKRKDKQLVQASGGS